MAEDPTRSPRLPAGQVFNPELCAARGAELGFLRQDMQALKLSQDAMHQTQGELRSGLHELVVEMRHDRQLREAENELAARERTMAFERIADAQKLAQVLADKMGSLAETARRTEGLMEGRARAWGEVRVWLPWVLSLLLGAFALHDWLTTP